MPERTDVTPASLALSLLAPLWGLLRAHRSAFRQQRPFLKAQAFVLGHLFSFARRTITQALVAWA